MIIKELIKKLKTIEDKDKKILVACDEEWNSIFENVMIMKEEDSGDYVIFGLSGSERPDKI